MCHGILQIYLCLEWSTNFPVLIHLIISYHPLNFNCFQFYSGMPFQTPDLVILPLDSRCSLSALPVAVSIIPFVVVAYSLTL